MVFPMEFQPRIPEKLLYDSRWIASEREILNRILKTHINKKEQLHKKAVKNYELELAIFIRKNYAILCSKRAKYIILYNSLKPD
jgi:hypothetical protein